MKFGQSVYNGPLTHLNQIHQSNDNDTKALKILAIS